jgi:conserved oligomeric Golgi complex subunit 6
LRSTIENEGLKVNEDFLTAAQGVITALDSVQQDLDQVANCCEKMTSWVLENKSSTAGLLMETDRLQKALEISQTRSQLLGTFLSQYQLSSAETQALQAESITPEFFEALDHVRTIHTNCKSLLRTHHQRAGLELLDSMASLQENAYERLCRWVQSECRGLSDIDSPEVDPLLQRAVASLKVRHVLFKYCAEEVAAARQSALFQRFIRALTRGPRPIEMHAPDPWRYASDMLAWVHTSLASEREFLTGLLGEDGNENEKTDANGDDNNHNNNDGLSGGDFVDSSSQTITISQLLSIVFEGICRPLRVRIEQVIISSPPPLLSFRLAQLIAFYLHTVDSMLGVASPLSDTLRACHSMAMRSFHEHLKHGGDRLVRYPPPPPSDLSLPSQLAEGIALASDLVESYETSLLTRSTSSGGIGTNSTGGTGGGAPGRKNVEAEDPTDFDAVLASVLTPLVAAAERSSDALNPYSAGRLDDGSHMDPSDQHIYMINCLHELQRPLLGHACASKQMVSLQQAVQGRLETLAAGEVQRILVGCGLAEVSERLKLYTKVNAAMSSSSSAGGEVGPNKINIANGTPASDPALSVARIGDATRTFFGKLSDPAALPEFRKLRVPLIKTEAVQRVLTALSDAYEEVYLALMAPESGYPAAEVGHVVKHTPAQVRTLLGVA